MESKEEYRKIKRGEIGIHFRLRTSTKQHYIFFLALYIYIYLEAAYRLPVYKTFAGSKKRTQPMLFKREREDL
jgi:hypothetical protein